jgi:hypothetical protein
MTWDAPLNFFLKATEARPAVAKRSVRRETATPSDAR